MMRGMTEQVLHHICLALGSNVGDKLANLRAAKKALDRYVTITGVSPVYETAPAYVTDQPDFLNAALTGFTLLEPLALMLTLKDIEKEIGRKPTFHFGPREIDIDLLFYDDLQMAAPELNIPHPLMAERSFVLRPLADIAPAFIHPVTGLSVRAMLEALPDQGGLRPIEEPL